VGQNTTVTPVLLQGMWQQSATQCTHLGVQALLFSGGDFPEIFIDSHIGIRYLTQCITGNELRVK